MYHHVSHHLLHTALNLLNLAANARDGCQFGGVPFPNTVTPVVLVFQTSTLPMT